MPRATNGFAIHTYIGNIQLDLDQGPVMLTEASFAALRNTTNYCHSSNATRLATIGKLKFDHLFLTPSTIALPLPIVGESISPKS